jgi:predicted acyl esterase
MPRRALILFTTLSFLLPVAARSASPPDEGTAFEPRSMSAPLYGTKPPWEDPDRQEHYVEAHDGVDLYVETWLPARKNGNVPPDRIPTILVMTPYVPAGEQEYGYEKPVLVDYFTARGYAVAQHHVRGNQESGGCMEQTSRKQIDGAARVIEYLGRDAPWSNGNVGTYGISYDAEAQTSVAGLGDPERIKYLKAIVPVSALGGLYEFNYMDGVPWVANAFTEPIYWAQSQVPGNRPTIKHQLERIPCGTKPIRASVNPAGNYGPYWRAHELRPGVANVKAATLYVHGLRDFNVLPITLAGWFSELPASTPHKGVFPVSDHSFPNHHPLVEPDWERTDWFDMVAAWYDRYLKGLATGVEQWPAVQVQDNLGRWWAPDEFPFTGGPPAHLALSDAGSLGSLSPEGSTSYLEQLHLGRALPGQSATFTTPALTAPLHIAGMPILDLWVELDRPDAHVAVALEVVGPDGKVMIHKQDRALPIPLSETPAATFGARSLQHLAPMTRGWFEQERAVEPKTGLPIRVNVRMLPTDLVVPVGARLRLTIAGSVSFGSGLETRTGLPSGSATTVKILHDCEHPSFLRFLLPPPESSLLNVREKNEKGPLASTPGAIGLEDGGGLARAQACGVAPQLVSLLRDGTEG